MQELRAIWGLSEWLLRPGPQSKSRARKGEHMRRVIALLVVLPIFLLGIGGGNGLELDSEERGASPDESWECDGPRADLVLAGGARAADDHMRITLEFENRTEFPVGSISLGAGERYEWGNDPNEPRPSVLRCGRQRVGPAILDINSRGS